MVSKTSAAIVGVALLGALFFLRSKSTDTITPAGARLDVQKQIENPAISVVKGQIKEVQSFIAATFKRIPTSRELNLCGGAGQFSCGRFNFSPQPRGSRFSINPFTGARIALPVGTRGSAATEAFQGGREQLAANQQLVTFGTGLRAQSEDLLSSLREKLGLLAPTINVSV